MACILNLSNDLLRDILDEIASRNHSIPAIDHREHLSVESFRPPTPPPPSQAQDVANFRLCCKRFGELGIPYQYSRLSLRFSLSGFRRLDAICEHAHLTRHTRKFSYLMPPFYASNAVQTTTGERSSLANHVERKVSEQRSLLRSAEDVRVLKKAMKSFTALQHIQLLRLIEPVELNSSRPPLNLEWPPACTHATKTMGEALIQARSPFCRFSGPMMEPHTARIIQENMLSILASRLTCLELHFDGGPELLERMVELSPLAGKVLQAAKNLQAIHVGFPSRFPLDLRLDTMFHNIHWKNLRAFGIQAWRLEAREIICIVRRHQMTLRGLRLRDVQLKADSRWQDVLIALRRDMRLLEWVSLRRIDYADHFDQLWLNTMEVPDDAPGSVSSEDSSEDGDDEELELPMDLGDQESIVGSEVEDSDEDEESLADTDHGPEADDIAISPETPVTLPSCTCDRSRDEFEISSADELGDNGSFVTYQQRKMWERWIVGKCPEHT